MWNQNHAHYFTKSPFIINDIAEEATHQEIAAQLSANNGGISEAFKHCWEAEEKALVTAMSCVYFLAKEEIHVLHMTKYKPLLAFLSQLGLPYLDTLHKGENATYTSHRIVDVFLTLLDDSVR